MKINPTFYFIIILIIAIPTLISCNRVPSKNEDNIIKENKTNMITDLPYDSKTENNPKESTSKSTQANEIMEFNLSDFEWEIENCSYESNVGAVDNEIDAVEYAMQIWKTKFGENIGGLYDVIKDHPMHIAFDGTNDCWHVNGGVSQHQLGAVPHVLIKSDGSVLAVWIG